MAKGREKIWHQTPFPGVRFRKHATRKHGVKADQYFQIRYMRDGRRVEESLGWASTDKMTARKAALILAELRENARKGEGETSLAEKREKAEEARQEKEVAEITFKQFWDSTYFPHAKREKVRDSVKRERALFEKYLNPVVGSLPFAEISVMHVERVKSNMTKAEQSPRSVQYCLAVLRQTINEAKRRGVYPGENVTRSIKRPKIDNRRLRFLTPSEAEAVLAELRQTDPAAADMALISIHCGLRAGEIFTLTRSDLNFERGTISVRQALKPGRGRYAYMTAPVKEMLAAKGPGEPEALLFPGPGGRIRQESPRTFKAAIDKLGLNKGITDRKNKLCFHSCRHSFASLLTQQGVDSRVIQELLGHQTPGMTARYSHLAPEAGRVALSALEGLFDEAKKDEEQGEDPEEKADQAG